MTDDATLKFNRKTKYLIKARDGSRCVVCGETDRLTIHHRNGDHSDNRHENLITLCETCHKKIHAPVLTKIRKRRVAQQIFMDDCIYLGYESPDYVYDLIYA